MKVYGPYKRKDGRLVIIKYMPHGTSITQSYPRFLMEQHLGRKLLATEVVDHINNNPSDNRIENLQVTSYKVNNTKDRNPPQMEEFECPRCGKIFKSLTKYYKIAQLRLGKAGPYCRSCLFWQF